MKGSPFQKDNDKFKILPSIPNNSLRDEVARKLLWAYVGYWGTFALWLIVSYNFIPMVFILGALMWILGGFTSIKLPAESPNIARKTRLTMLGFILGLLALRMIISMVLNTPVELWEKALKMDLPPAFANTFMGFLSMAFMISMFMGFIAYLQYIIQLFMFHQSDKRTSDYLKKIMRREDGK